MTRKPQRPRTQYLGRRSDGRWLLVHAEEIEPGVRCWAYESGGHEEPTVVYALPTGRVAAEPSLLLRKLRGVEVDSASPITG